MLEGVEGEQGPQPDHGASAVQDLLLRGERPHRGGFRVGLVRNQRAEDDDADGEDESHIENQQVSHEELRLMFQKQNQKHNTW
mgnify:CR=1 FL=1